MFMPFTATESTMVHFMTVSVTPLLGSNQLMIWPSLFLLVTPMLITLNGWSRSLLQIDVGVMILIFFDLSGCEQSMRCPIHIAGNKLDLVMTDVPDIVDVVVG